ncbi:MAG: ATP-binding protein, partial [Gemmatimonadota bacterium]|nr:ATP-binding protein [Gemmatimonadota bacterium]
MSAVQRILAEQQRVADAELLASHQATRMRAIIDGTGVLAWEFDLVADRFTYVSAEGTGFGRPAESWLEPGFWRTLVHADDLDAVEAFLRIGAFVAEHRRLEFRVVAPGGASRWLAMVVSPRAPAHAAAMLSGVLIDVSEARRLRDAAEAASRAKSEFVANMSHEIRTPLTAILGYAELLREDGDAAAAPVARLQTIDTIRTAGQYLLNVINDILDLSKIEAGRMTVETITVDLPALLIDCENLLGPRAAAKGLTFSVALASPLPRHAITDPTRLRQILLNLAGNAIKFTTTGRVTVRASVVNPDDTVQTLRLDVEDTGPGLTAEQASHLFQAFSQADSSVTRLHGGTGLGLTISRRLAGLMGGNVQLHRTAPHAGSTFRIEVEVIPAADADLVESLRPTWTRDTSAPAAVAAAPTRLSGRVLVAEDNPVNQRLLEVFLGKAGAEVAVTSDGAQALARLDAAAAEGAPFDLLVTDVQMPVMDGYTLVRTLRAQGCVMPVIALTANAMAGDRQLCLDAGCDDYAPKPIDLPGLVAMCGLWIDRAHSAARPAPLALVPDAPAHQPPSRPDADPLLQTA